MIEKSAYNDALKIVKAYEQQMLNSCDVPCYIMHRPFDDLVFVTTDEDFANRLYNTGDYIMKISKLINPR